MGCGTSTDVSERSKISADDVKNGSAQRRQEAVEPIELTDGLVDQYIQLEMEIHSLEMKRVTQKHEEKVREADTIKKTVDQLEATCKELKKQNDKKKADVENLEQPSVRSFLKQQGTYEAKLAKEQREYQECLSRLEAAEKELTETKAHYERALKIVEIYKRRADRLNELYDKEDSVLAGIYGGQYGSESEKKLENDLDVSLEWQQRVSLARFKWTNGRVLLVHACTQMAFGVKRWQELEMIEMSNTRARYFAAAEARNNFVAASQNVQSCRVYLGKVQFPYCTEDEMEEMEKAINTAFSDIQSTERYSKSLNLYQTIHRQVASLIQWFDQVINETIIVDYERSMEDVASIQKELRQERLRLMKEAAQSKLGREIIINFDEIVPDADDDEKELHELEAELNGENNNQEKLKNLLSMTQPAGNTLANGQLAPIPSNETLFGNVASIRKQYDQERRELEKQQEAARLRMDQGLQEKLQQRRTRGGRRKSMMITADRVLPQ